MTVREAGLRRDFTINAIYQNAHNAQLLDPHGGINDLYAKKLRATSEHFAEEKASMEPLPKDLPDTDLRQVIRVPAQPYLRLDTNDYSLDPRLVGKRVEVRASQELVTATELDTGRVACHHTRHFAKGLTFTDPAHQEALDQMRFERKDRKPSARQPEVEIRPLARYDQLIGA